MHQLLLVDRAHRLLDVAHAGQHPEDLLERPHLPDRLQLIAKILQREIVRAKLLLELLRVLDVDRRFGALDEREHVAHPEHARHDAVGMERLEIVERLAAADERDRHADDRDHGQRRAATRVAVHLRQHDAAHADARVELAGALDRVLPGHRVGDEQQVRRIRRGLDRGQLRHQLVVDVETARRVHDHRIEPERRRLGDRAFRARDRIEHARRIVNAHARLLSDDGQLLNRRRALHVGGDEHGMLALLRQPLRELARRGRLARALQPEHQHDAGPLARRLQSPFGAPEERDHLVADDLDDFLRGRQAAQDVLPRLHRVHRPVADAVDECLDDLEVDVGLQERQADLAQRGLDVLGREPRFAAKTLEDVLETGTEGFEHTPLNRSTANAYRI